VTSEERLHNAVDREKELSKLPETLIEKFSVACSSALGLQVPAGPFTENDGCDPVDTLFLDDEDLELEGHNEEGKGEI
jgi:hypothetical protein